MSIKSLVSLLTAFTNVNSFELELKVPEHDLPVQVTDPFDELTKDKKAEVCLELDGVMIKGKCYTWEGAFNDSAGVERQACECPGECAVWNVTCAPETW